MVSLSSRAAAGRPQGLGKPAPSLSLTFADDFGLTGVGPGYASAIFAVIWWLRPFNLQISWKKAKGGRVYTWAGYEKVIASWLSGISQSRADWTSAWLDASILARKINTGVLSGALGRLAFLYGASKGVTRRLPYSSCSFCRGFAIAFAYGIASRSCPAGTGRRLVEGWHQGGRQLGCTGQLGAREGQGWHHKKGSVFMVLRAADPRVGSLGFRAQSACPYILSAGVVRYNRWPVLLAPRSLLGPALRVWFP